MANSKYLPKQLEQLLQRPIQDTPNSLVRVHGAPLSFIAKCCRLNLNANCQQHFVMGPALVTLFIYLFYVALVAEDVASNYLQLTNN